jgi:hypothetical protein
MPAKENSTPKPTSRRLGLIRLLALSCGSLAVVLACYGQSATAAKPEAVPHAAFDPTAGERPVPPTPAPVLDIVEIQPFRLKTGYRYDWLQQRPIVSAGLLVVLRVDPKYVVPRNIAEPVLFADSQTVQRLNQGNRSGCVIAIIPGEVDLGSAPIWFGRPQLPERVTPQIIAAERALAERAAIKPFSADKVKAATRNAIVVEDLGALLRGPAAELVLKYSPDEKELAETWRLSSGRSDVPQSRQ